jgi:YbgC/YbaW family acyl-CoA thioester hydrolase
MRVKIAFPKGSPLSSLRIPVRIGDINYGGHVGNDAILSIIHEARMQWLAAAGFTELEVGGHGLIMADVMIAYKGESFYGDVLAVSLYLNELTGHSFDLLYRITTIRDGKEVVVAEAKTGMVCFDYDNRKIVQIGAPLMLLLTK